jgi:hypothetical protein
MRQPLLDDQLSIVRMTGLKPRLCRFNSLLLRPRQTALRLQLKGPLPGLLQAMTVPPNRRWFQF